MQFAGPQKPNGRQTETPATGEPADSRNVVTYCLSGKKPETTSNNQLDYVFASSGFHEGIMVKWREGGRERIRQCLLIEVAHSPLLSSLLYGMSPQSFPSGLYRLIANSLVQMGPSDGT